MFESGGWNIPGHLRGTIVALTEVSRDIAPQSFEELAPFVLAIVDVEMIEGKIRRMTMQMTDLEPCDPRIAESKPLYQQVNIGEVVEVITRKLSVRDEGPIVYGYKARKPLR